MDKVRSEFEAWAKQQLWDTEWGEIEYGACGYLSDLTQGAWLLWQDKAALTSREGEAVAWLSEDGCAAVVTRTRDGMHDSIKRGYPTPLTYLHHAPSARVAELSVWYGAMPESNGKSNWTAVLVRDGDIVSGYTFARSEYEDRVRYEADSMRFIIGEIDERPDLMAYDPDKHSGYIYPQSAEAARIAALESQLAASREREAKLIADLDANLDAYSDERKRALSAENLARELHELLTDYVSQDSIAQGYGSGVGGTTYQKAEAFLDALAADKENSHE